MNIFQKIRDSFGKKTDTAEAEKLLMSAAKRNVQPLSENEKGTMLNSIFENAKPETSAKAGVIAGATVLTTRFAPVVLRVIISTMVLVLLAGGAWMISPAPVAQGSEKGHTVEVPRNAQLRVVFDQRMNHASVESAFAITPFVTGKFGWSDNVLTFTPDSVLNKGTTYEVTISTSAQNFLGKNLVVPFKQWFKTTDEPGISVVAPGDGSQIKPNQTLTVIFDHPIRNLTGSLKVPELLKIEPVVAGRYNWLGTSGFEFIPNSGWTPATDFNVTVPSGFTFADGSTLTDSYSWRFRTADLQVYDGSNNLHHRTKEPFVMSFNFPVKVAEVMKSIVIRENGVSMPLTSFAFSPSTVLASKITITPRGVLKLGAVYDMALPAGWTGGVGTRGLSNDWASTIKMDESGFVLKVVCPDDGEQKNLWDSVSIGFNNPIENKNLANFVSISPALKDIRISTNGWSSSPGCQSIEGGSMISISGTWKASTKYTVTVRPGIKDIYGQVLGAGRIWSFTTEAYQPSLDLNSYSDQGVLISHMSRIYQMRVRNFTHPITVTLIDGTGTQLAKQDFDTTATLNVHKVIELDLDKLAGHALPNGRYSLGFDVPDLPYEWNRRIDRNIMIIDTVLTVKRDHANKVLVWATNAQTGEVMPDVQISLENTATPYNATTNEQGLAEFASIDINNLGKGPIGVIAIGASHYGYTSLSWNDGIGPWNYNLTQSYTNRLNSYVGMIYTDRKIYRPEQNVKFKGVIRADYDAKYEVPKMTEISVTIENSVGERVLDTKLPMSRYGSFDGELALDSSAKLGDYRITVIPSGNDSWENRIVGTFTVAEFRRPDFKVTVLPSKDSVIQNSPLLATIRADYYTGAPLGGGKVSYAITTRRLDIQPLDGEWFSFSDDENSDCYWYCSSEGAFGNVISGTHDLNTDGVYALPVPTSLSNFKGSAVFTIEASVEDVNHRFVSNRIEVPVYRGEFALGVRANYDEGWNSSNANFDVVTLTNDGAARAGVAGTAKLYRRVWANARKENVDGSTFWDSTTNDTFISQATFVTDEKGRTTVGFMPELDGEYYVVVSSFDNLGNALSARASRYIYRGGESTIRVTDDHMMKIVQNKADYKVGDTASLVVQTPYGPTKALVTVERETIRSYYVIDLSSTSNVIQIPIIESAVPNIYVSVTTVKGGDAGIPEFRMGYADLRVDTSGKVLDIGLTTDKKEYKPGDTVTISVDTVRRGTGPVKAEVSIAVVDERVVSLLGSVNKNILGAFWFRREIGVDTAQTLTRLIKKLYAVAGEGEGDGKGGGDSAVPIRGNFQDTAYWNAKVETNAAGRASISFKLPDNLTDWQILAIGNTENTVVGSAETSISTRKLLTVEPLLPRFVRYGDTVKLGASVENGTGVGKNVDVKIKADGLNLTESATRTVWVAPKTRVGVTWNVKVPYNVKEAKITVTGIASDSNDGYEMKIPVLSYSVAEMVTASNIMEKSATETIEIPENILAEQSTLRVAVSPNVGQGLASGVDYLLAYEYGCAEQTTSAVMTGTIYEELAKLKFTKATPEQIEFSKAKVNGGIQKLLAMQRGDGGFGYWSDSKRSYPHVSAYVLWGMYEAKQAGFTVDDGAMNRLSDYLMNYLAMPESGPEYYWLSLNEKSQVIFVLSETGRTKLSGYADALYEKRSQLADFGKGFLAMSYGNINSRSDAKTAELMKEIENNIVYLDATAAYVHENEGYGYFMSSDLRSTAITLMSYLRLEPGHENAERLVRWMMRQKNDGYWSTTQETSFALLSLIEYAKKNPIDTAKVDVSVFLDSKIKDVITLPEGDISTTQAVTYNLGELLKGGSTHQVGLDKDSPKRYFYDVSMKVYRQIEDIKPFENGFTVISDYYAKDDVDFKTPLREVKQGDVVRVRMKLIVPKQRQYVAFEQHLPAGLEPIDFQLKTSNQALNQDSGGGNYNEMGGSYNDYGKGGVGSNCAYDLSGYESCLDSNSWDYRYWWENVWNHTEIRDDRMFLFADTIEPGIYDYTFFAQAVTVGEYRVPPARAYEMYDLTANGHNEGRIFRVK
ncbi:MAG: Ig-like domain-containing protein [bacterium]